MAAIFNTRIIFQNMDPQPEEFPKELDINEKEAITYHTFKENIKRAQDLYMPGYLVAVTQLKNGKFQIYDGCSFRRNQRIRNKNEDPMSRSLIEKTYYFVIHTLFGTKDDGIEDVVLDADDIRAHPLKLHENDLIQAAFFESLNYLAMEEAAADVANRINNPIQAIETILHVRQSQQYTMDQEDCAEVIAKLGGKDVWEFAVKQVFGEGLEALKKLQS